MPDLTWYWSRLRAMSPGEVLRHGRRKLRQRIDARCHLGAIGFRGDPPRPFPAWPAPETAPASVRAALVAEAARIRRGRWKAFGDLELVVDDPPHWHRDYLAGTEVVTEELAFRLDHRSLPAGADSKLIWELSRWHAPVQLAMAAYVGGDTGAGIKSLEWLEDWTRANPPGRGWNWTSALEAGIRLIQFTWIDALLTAARGSEEIFAQRLRGLRSQILVAHVRFAWRHQSFGSSANNHLLGELAGVAVALARWPELARWCAPVKVVQQRWEHEVLAQFAPDGGNREQALNYQIFSWELCWHTLRAFQDLQMPVSETVPLRLAAALRFYHETQAHFECWDYGDSDDGFVTPMFLDLSKRVPEWRAWARDHNESPGIHFWLGPSPLAGQRLGDAKPVLVEERAGWWIYPESGMASHESGFWGLRWDLSPLGYLSTAAHGHLDALHLSVWYRGVALVIDPGTGAYYADPVLREFLASRAAHNGPSPLTPGEPHRLGPFLWSSNHGKAVWRQVAEGLEAESLGFVRRISPVPGHGGWQVEDRIGAGGPANQPFVVRWQFAPGTVVKRHSERQFSIRRADRTCVIELGEEWQAVELVEPAPPPDRRPGQAVTPEGLPGVISPAFRMVTWAPFLRLLAAPKGTAPCVFRTTFLVSSP